MEVQQTVIAPLNSRFFHSSVPFKVSAVRRACWSNTCLSKLTKTELNAINSTGINRFNWEILRFF